MTTKSAPKAPEAAPSIDGLSGKKLKVTFHKNPESGGSDHGVYIGLNGKVYAYQFEVPVDVPVEVLDIADNAVIRKYQKVGDKGDIKAVEIKRYPYSTSR